jgi:UTP--glucose-1-phosphate uridylyltransferase
MRGMSAAGLAAAEQKMRSAGVDETAIAVFQHYYRQLEQGATGLIPEADIEPLANPTRLADLPIDEDSARPALDATVVIKLNGGLGTSMGMEQAKTLLPVRGELTFLDILARQVLAARKKHGVTLPVMFMNSFRTRDDSLALLSTYPDLAVDGLPLDFLQSREPKLRVDDLTPAEWPADPSLEWCPPGHGDLYATLWGSGLLDRLGDKGIRYAFVSNGDNLGATADPRVAGWFASSGLPYATEVCVRTPADRKGGHLAIRRADGQLVLRDSAQTPDEDIDAFQDIQRHRYFHANTLWIDLTALRAALSERDGVLGLPLIRNEKNVDPGDKASPTVVQIETAMGAAVEIFPGAVALEVDRSRFLPVKSTNDLLAMRSDAYTLDDDAAIELAAGRDAAPLVDLDPHFYSLVAEFDRRFPDGAPSLVRCRSLKVAGDWTFRGGVACVGDVSIGPEGSPGEVAPESSGAADG